MLLRLRSQPSWCCRSIVADLATALHTHPSDTSSIGGQGRGSPSQASNRSIAAHQISTEKTKDLANDADSAVVPAAYCGEGGTFVLRRGRRAPHAGSTRAPFEVEEMGLSLRASIVDMGRRSRPLESKDRVPHQLSRGRRRCRRLIVAIRPFVHAAYTH